MRLAVAVVVLLTLTGPAAAQVERYELGRRLRLFEAEWEKQPDPAARKRALKVVEKASRQFLTFQLSEAMRTLDDARFALRSADPPPRAERWLAALAVAPEKRLVDAATKELAVEVRAMYDVPGGVPEGVELKLRIGEGDAVDVPLEKLPAKGPVPFPRPDWAGDQLLWMEATVRGTPVGTDTVQVSAVRDLDVRLKRVAAQPLRGDIERATARTVAELLTGLSSGQVSETDYPSWRLFLERDLLNLLSLFHSQPLAQFTDVFTLRPRGEFWLTLPTAGGKETPCRVLIPARNDPIAFVPVVVALHGAGGSENLFFDGYGAGCVPKACAKRGWVCVAPRGGLGFLGGPPPVPDILDKLAERYPIDRKRVFLIGHSMGAAQAVELAQKHPGAFAGVAVLGGGGRVKKPEAFADLPTFVGVGSADFARGGAERLAKELTAGGAKRLTFKEYEDVEHLVIVRMAVDDVFAGFDAVVGGK